MVCSSSITTSLAYDLHQSDISITFDGTVDAETRRQLRLERLEKHSKLSTQKASIDKRDEIPVRETKQNKTDCNRCSSTSEEDFVLGPNFMFDINQRNSILSDSPAVLLSSPAGSGKTTVLAGRVAHLLESNKIKPQNMIILSFTKKDATSLKEKALEIIYENDCNGHYHPIQLIGLPRLS